MSHPLIKILKPIIEGMKIPMQNPSLVKLHGDASNRVYYRLHLSRGQSFIVMQLPKGPASVSEEITNLKERPSEIPFIAINRYLAGRGLPVPKIYHEAAAEGLILLEDFGDETLEKRVASCAGLERVRWYRKAIDLLILFQERGMEKGPPCIAHQRSFDGTLLNWEFEHFREYGIEARTGRKIDEADLKTIRQGTNFITFALLKLPQTFVHRDFQSRNLMIQGEDLKLLDFQDALMGPYLYDLVALLRDSYVNLPWPLVKQLVDYYLKDRAGSPLDYKMFDWMTIQRKLKDAGRFVYIDRMKRNPSFLQWIPNSLAYVKEAFERQPELKALFEVLRKYVPELE